jgi:hypothetical protein
MDPVLTAEQVEQFLTKGYVKLPGCFSREAAHEYSRHIWDRLGYAEHDPSTWAKPSVHMAPLTDIDVRTFAPAAWRAACELIGGADRMAGGKSYPWTDAFIANLTLDAEQPWTGASAATPGWHVDGSWFRHYLDSPEQGLLTIVLWSEVVHQGGATFLATDSIGPVARFLAAHPEGVLPGRDADGNAQFPYQELVRECSQFVEATGDIGDVYLVHPFVLHTKSPNVLRRPRFITNSTLMLAEPLDFDRPDPADHSPVERAVLRALGVDRLEFTASGPRGRLQPEVSPEIEKAKQAERARLAAAGRR